ncbi:MAG: putative N-formylglutamate amidohydrolase [Paracoccaceae bacterium]
MAQASVAQFRIRCNWHLVAAARTGIYGVKEIQMPKFDSAVTIIGENRLSDVVVTCDHASNNVPDEIGGLGLPTGEMERHIAYDIGAAGVSKHLAQLLTAPLVMSGFSRLVIDPNRGEDDPTLIMQLYDGTIISGNRNLSKAQRLWRLENCYRPYHAAVRDLLNRRAAPMIVAIHSFTSQLAGRPKRPWHIGVLHHHDTVLAAPLLKRLQAEPDLCVGENEPYGGHLVGDSIDRHALAKDRPNVLIEIRNDLIETADQQIVWAERLAPMLAEIIARQPALKRSA